MDTTDHPNLEQHTATRNLIAGMKARFFDVTSATSSKAAVHPFSYQSACNHSDSVSLDPQILDPAGIGFRNRRGCKLLSGCISAGSFAHVSVSLTRTWQRGCEASACHRSCRTRELPALSEGSVTVSRCLFQLSQPNVRL